MLDIKSSLKSIRRPKLLMQAARYNLQRYDRTRHLSRVIQGGVLNLGPSEALFRLMEEERVQNDQRQNVMAGYDISHHILVLTAMLFEVGRI